METVYKHYLNPNWVTAWQAGKLVGYLKLDVQAHAVVFDSIIVADECKRQGIGTGLLRFARQEYPGKNFDPGQCTPEGAAWWEHVREEGDYDPSRVIEPIDVSTVLDMKFLGEWLAKNHTPAHS